MRWHKESQANPFPPPQVGPTPVQAPQPGQRTGPRPTAPNEKSIQNMPEWKRNQVVSEILKLLGTASSEHLSALRDKMKDPNFMQGLAPKPQAPAAPPMAMPPQTQQQRPATSPFDRSTPKIDQLQERMKGMDIKPYQTPVGTTPLTTKERSTMGRPPGMEQFVKQKQRGL